ncbi:hypothetical protein [Gimesia aquarii]|uniref:Uncharacterized protein n=1 Tax=Gimesia aquarii TaxID=2527964 RepID=A0A517W2T7_9PLAN|nr:hypothetical protein [Gimesia aquarii]QDT99572.1 hypothetical protein V144x_50840 [Gimesia aquarii]
MLFTLGKLIVKGYGLLLAMAVGGLVFANLFGLIAFFVLAQEWVSDRLQASGGTESVLWWMHCGWFVGAGLALFGTVTQNQKIKKRSFQVSVDHEDEPETPAPKKWKKKRRTKPSGILSSIGVFSLFGGFLGLMLGGSLLLFWFSLTYSPFAPAGWASSVSVEQRQEPGSGQTKSMMTTNHPVAFYLFGTPIVLGITAGALAGGIGAAMGKVEDIE